MGMSPTAQVVVALAGMPQISAAVKAHPLPFIGPAEYHKLKSITNEGGQLARWHGGVAMEVGRR